jgi:hypothetical protein
MKSAFIGEVNYLQQLLGETHRQLGVEVMENILEEIPYLFKGYLYYSPPMPPYQVEKKRIKGVNVETYYSFYYHLGLDRKNEQLKEELTIIGSRVKNLIVRENNPAIIGQKESGELLYCYGEQDLQLSLDVMFLIEKGVQDFYLAYPLNSLMPICRTIQRYRCRVTLFLPKEETLPLQFYPVVDSVEQIGNFWEGESYPEGFSENL